MEELLSLFNRFSLLVQRAFQDDPRFLTARDKAYKVVVNDTSVFRMELPSGKAKYVCVSLRPCQAMSGLFQLFTLVYCLLYCSLSFCCFCTFFLWSLLYLFVCVCSYQRWT